MRRVVCIVILLAAAALACGPFSRAENGVENTGDKLESGSQGEIKIDDLPMYPGAQRDEAKEADLMSLTEKIGVSSDAITGGEVRVYTTSDDPTTVGKYFRETLKAEGWTNQLDQVSDEGGILTWVKAGYILSVLLSPDAETGETIIIYGLNRIDADETAEGGGEATEEAGDTGGGEETGGAFDDAEPLPPGGSPPPDGISLLPTAPLREGIAGWDEWLQAGARHAGDNRVETVGDPTYGSVVAFTRTDGERDGGAAGITQSPNLDVTGCDHLYVWLLGRVLSEQGGNIANTDPRWFPEGAVQVRVMYETAGGGEGEWWHGFYGENVGGADGEHFTQVAAGEWFTYTSPDLMALPEPPARITGFKVYGFGWEFEGQAASVHLVGQMGDQGNQDGQSGSQGDQNDGQNGQSGPPLGFLWQVERPLGEGLEAFGRLGGLAPSGDGFLYVADRDNGLWVIDPVTGVVAGLVNLRGAGVEAVDVTFGNDPLIAYIADAGAGAITAVHMGTWEEQASFGGGAFRASPESVSIDSEGNVYATAGGELYKFDPDGGTLWAVDGEAVYSMTPPVKVAMAPDVTLYLVDAEGQIIHLDTDGELLSEGLVEPDAAPVSDVAVGIDGNLNLATHIGLLLSDPGGYVMGAYGIPAGEGYPEGGYLNPQGTAAYLDGTVFYTDVDTGSGYAIVGAFRFP